MNKEQQLIYKKIISKYNFNGDQKEQIRLGLENELDVSIYLNPNMSWEEMKKSREYMLEIKNKTPIKIIPNNYLYGIIKRIK